MSGVSAVLGESYNFEDVKEKLPLPPMPAPVRNAPVEKPAIPAVLPAAEEIGKARSRSASLKPGDAVKPQPTEWKGVAAMADENITMLKNSSPVVPRTAAAKAPAQPAAEPAATTATSAIPVVLPSAEIGKGRGELKAMPLQPRTDWGGVSSQLANEYNHAVPNSPQLLRAAAAPPAEPAAEPAEEPKPAATLIDTSASEQEVVTSRVRRPSTEINPVKMTPVTYGGVASALGDEYNAPPSPVLERPRRSRNNSKEANTDATAKTEAYPVAPPEPEKAFDEYAYDIASLRAKKEIGKGPAAVHHGFSPLSSIVG